MNGRSMTLLESLTRPWFWAWAVTLFVFPLIWVGGLVTTHDAGMAVPDWPGTYGYNLFLYPLSAWLYGPFDLFIEHGHRLLGSFVGLLTIGLCVVSWRCDPRSWYRWASLGLLLAVIAQGLLGGFRVVLDARTIAMLHGCGGPLVFAYATFMALAASSDWKGASRTIGPRGLRRLATVLLVSTVVQLILGAQLRHAMPDLLPSGFMSLVHLHLTVAGLLTLVILTLTFWVRRLPYRLHRELRSPANALLLVLFLQLGLGIATWVVNYALPWTDLSPSLAQYAIHAKGYWESLIITGHQATGSLLIAMSVWMVCRVARRQAQLVANSHSYTISERQVVAAGAK
jgi:cytochrome c oxidase assembly protein subunit 15